MTKGKTTNCSPYTCVFGGDFIFLFSNVSKCVVVVKLYIFGNPLLEVPSNQAEHLSKCIAMHRQIP